MPMASTPQLCGSIRHCASLPDPGAAKRAVGNGRIPRGDIDVGTYQVEEAT